MGFEGTDLDTTIDLGTQQLVTRIGVDCLQSQTSWIFYPNAVRFETSDDGITWDDAGIRQIPVEPEARPSVLLVSSEMEPRTARFVRVRAESLDRCPDWHQGAGGLAWVFVDEIVVD
jgi:hexosaminidase